MSKLASLPSEPCEDSLASWRAEGQVWRHRSRPGLRAGARPGRQWRPGARPPGTLGSRGGSGGQSEHCCAVADRSPITTQDVEIASVTAIAALDESFFRVRFDRLNPSERRYLRSMAQLGPGPHRSGDIAHGLQRGVQSVAPTRSNLIAKGLVWSPSHGDTVFTVPLFDEFMCRIMPGEDWRS